jgi:hypothetical protein
MMSLHQQIENTRPHSDWPQSSRQPINSRDGTLYCGATVCAMPANIPSAIDWLAIANS